MSIKDNKAEKSKEEDRWNKIFKELTIDLTPMQASVYKQIFQTIWDTEFTFLPVAPYDEVVLRSLFEIHPNGKSLEEDLTAKRGKEEYLTTINELLAKEGKEVKDTIDELCAKGIISCKMIRYENCNKDGILEKVSEPQKILVMRDTDRRILMQAMTEANISNFDSFGLPSGEL